jgi:hypothetical protein
MYFVVYLAAVISGSLQNQYNEPTYNHAMPLSQPIESVYKFR